MHPIPVQIIAAPIACQEGVKDAWRDTARWLAAQLQARFGDQVLVQYFDLFDPACPPLPADALLPLVLIQSEVLSSGGKISLPAIRRKIQTLMEQEKA